MGDDQAGVPGYGNQLINYLYRQSLSVAALVIIEQFHLSNVAYSRIIFAFMLAYTVTNGISGPMIDRLGAKLGYAVCIAWWSIAAMLHSLARGAFSFGAYRFLLGMGSRQLAGRRQGSGGVLSRQRTRAGLRHLQ